MISHITKANQWVFLVPQQFSVAKMYRHSWMKFTRLLGWNSQEMTRDQVDEAMTDDFLDQQAGLRLTHYRLMMLG